MQQKLLNQTEPNKTKPWFIGLLRYLGKTYSIAPMANKGTSMGLE